MQHFEDNKYRTVTAEVEEYTFYDNFDGSLLIYFLSEGVEKQYSISSKEQDFDVLYVMNKDGKTIETLRY